MVAEPNPTYTETEYLMLERDSDVRHEYYEGEIVAMVGASEAHNLIVTSTVFSLYGQLRARPCRIYSNDMRVRVAATGLDTYPDLIVICGESQFTDDTFETLANPTIIIEVLSDSTERYDRGKKFQHYRTLASLREYLLIAQDTAHIEHFVREGDGSWRLTEAAGIATTIRLPAIGCTLPLAEVYEKVVLAD